jgi:hypothetical protein
MKPTKCLKKLKDKARNWTKWLQSVEQRLEGPVTTQNDPGAQLSRRLR